MSKVKFSGNIEIEIEKFGVDKKDVESIFIPEVCELISILHGKFMNRRDQLLSSRKRRQEHFDQGKYPEYPPKDSDISVSDWKVGNIPNNLLKGKSKFVSPLIPTMICLIIIRLIGGLHLLCLTWKTQWSQGLIR